MLLKKGAEGRNVKEVQTLLAFHGFWTYHKFTTTYGTVTETAVKLFQKAKGLKPIDGEVGPLTLNELLRGVDTDKYTIDDKLPKPVVKPVVLGTVAPASVKPVTSDKPIKDTDNVLSMKGSYTTKNGLLIDKAYLDTDEYVTDYGKIKPLSFFIHHTAGWNNPYSTIVSWNKDDRGRVATPYCIGGISIIKGKYDDAKFDGKVVECIPDGYIGWHLGKVGNFEISKMSSAVEICNFGWAEKKGDKFFTYTGAEVPKEMVCDLGYKFRGYQFWHAYTPAQIEALKQLIIHVHAIYPSIKIKKGLPELLANGMSAKDAFEFQPDAYNAKQHGLWSHTNVRKDKTDMFPQHELVEMLKWVYHNL